MEADVINLNTDPNSPINRLDDNAPLKKAIYCKGCTEYKDLDGNILYSHDLDKYESVKDFCSDECEELYREEKIYDKIERLQKKHDIIDELIEIECGKLNLTESQVIEFCTNPDLNVILRESCMVFGVTSEYLTSKYQGGEVTKQRYVVMMLMKSLTKASLATIGVMLGNKDHASVLHGCKMYEILHWQKGTEWMKRDFDKIKIRIMINFLKQKP